MTPAVAAAKALLLPTAALDRHVSKVQASAATPETSRLEAQRRYGFRVGGMGFLTAPHVGSEAIAMPAISSIPNSVAWLRGVMNLRGALVPVFDLAQALDMPEPAQTAQTSVLIFDKGPQAVGIVIESLPRLLPGLIPIKQMPDLPAALSGGMVTAGYTAGNEIWLEIDHVRFLTSLKDGAPY